MRRILRVCCALLLAIALIVPHTSALASDAPGRVLLSWTDDPATTVTVTWTSPIPINNEELIINNSTGDDLVFDAEVVPDLSGFGGSEVRYTATAVGLTPGTSYSYRVGGGDAWSEERTFTTASRGEGDFSFLYLGDIQVTERADADYPAWGELVAAAYAKNPGLAFALQGGDIVESGISTEQWGAFSDAATPVFSKIPFMPTNGNHESNFLSGKPELYLDTFTLPRNGPTGFTEEFYSFDYGTAHITVLNSWVFSGEQKLTSAQLDAIDAWVALDLIMSDAPFKIAVTHVPLYPVHSDVTGNIARAHWASLFEKYGVTLVFVGHQHVYSRLKPLTRGAEDYGDGVTYIMGNSGRKFYDSADETLAARTVYNVSNYQLATVSGDELTVQTFDIDGNELDYAVLRPRTGENVTRAASVDLLYRLSGAPDAGVPDGAPFADVPIDSEYADAISWAKRAGLINGVGGGRFAPEAYITRGHMDLLAARYAKYEGAAK